MPPHFGLAPQPCADNWTLRDDTGSPVLDTMIPQAGWHFVWVRGFYSHSGVGRSRDGAIHRALARVLKGLKMRFNAAELESVQVSSYPFFHIAKVTVQACHIQKHASLEQAVEDDARAVPTR